MISTRLRLAGNFLSPLKQTHFVLPAARYTSSSVHEINHNEDKKAPVKAKKSRRMTSKKLSDLPVALLQLHTDKSLVPSTHDSNTPKVANGA